MAALAACAPGTADAPGGSAGPIRPGIDVLVDDSLHLVAGRRVGLITNRSGLARDGRSSIDVLHSHPDIELVALFAPEHGIRGTAAEGAAIDDATDAATGLPIRSLYGETRAPTPAMLADLDVLVFDIQDIGSRYYTYVSTMALAMEAAGAAGMPFVVLDRPNPIGGAMGGPVLDAAYATFVGMFETPVRHGMTVGELARLFTGAFGIEAELHVVPAAGWTRDIWFDDTGLSWVAPSLNMPTLESATHYPGTCLFEGTNLSVGRGTDAPFSQVGAPFLDGGEWVRALARYDLPGVRIDSLTFTPVAPTDGKWADTPVHGLRFTVTDRRTYEPVRVSVAALLVARELAGEAWEWNVTHFDRLAGSDRLRSAIEAGDPLDTIVARWGPEIERFERLRAPYLLYGTGASGGPGSGR